MVNQVSDAKNIDPESVEKDWWVTMVLKAVFGMSIAKYAFFKGGTSLSKGWNLINRFSEDIDIALYRDFFLTERGLACARCENNNQVKCVNAYRLTMTICGRALFMVRHRTLTNL